MCFASCFGQPDHLQGKQLCTEYVGGNYEHEVLKKEIRSHVT
jgi:hypothetical protein